MRYNDETTVSVNFTVMTEQHDSDEMISCFIPAINQHFSARTQEDVHKKAKAFISLWIEHFNQKNQVSCNG